MKRKHSVITMAKALLIPILAGLVYGGWAGFANAEHGFDIALRSGLGQGIYAFFSTWLVTSVAKNAFEYLGKGKKASVVGFAASFAVMLFIPLSVHAAIDTPNVWQAITPGLIWGSGYIAAFLWHLYRQELRLSSEPIANH